jgi:hypothetical protein
MSLQSDTMSPQSSECSSDNFSVEDLFSQTDLSQNIPFDFTSNDPLVLTLNGSYANKSSILKLSELHSEDCGLIVSDCGLIVSDGTELNESNPSNKSSVLILIPSISIS